MASDLFRRFFPMPKTLAMRGGGIEISERTVKFFRFEGEGDRRRVAIFGEAPLAQGVIERGEIRDADTLVKTLRQVKERCGFTYVHASLPEQNGYLFDVSLPRESATSLGARVALALASHVPLSPAEAVFDCEGVAAESDATNRSLVVTVLPEALASAYAQALSAGGFFPISFELEPQAAVRAISRAVPQATNEATLYVDFGSGKTVISVVQNGAVRFTTSADGTMAHDEELARVVAPGVTVEKMKMEEGLAPDTATERLFAPAATALSAALERVMVYWNSKSQDGERREPLGHVILYGGNANVRGICEYLSGVVRLPCAPADLRPALTGESGAVPSIPKEESLRFATVIGLALRREYIS